MTTTDPTTIRLSQTASWNPELRNPYRTRYAEVAGRYFRIEATSLDAMWWVEEIDADGETLTIEVEGEPLFGGRLPSRREQIVWGKWAFRLSDARQAIAERVDGAA